MVSPAVIGLVVIRNPWGRQLIIWRKRGFDWPHGPYPPSWLDNLVNIQLLTYRGRTPCSFHQPTAPSHPLSRFSVHVQTPNTLSNYNVRFSSSVLRKYPHRVCSASSNNSPHPRQHSHGIFLASAQGYITVTSSLTTFHEFPIFTAPITNQGAAWTPLHSLSDSAPPRRVFEDGKHRPRRENLFTLIL